MGVGVGADYLAESGEEEDLVEDGFWGCMGA